MTKQSKTLLLLLIVLLLVAGCFAAVKLLMNDTETDAAEETEEATVLFSAEELTEFSYTYAGKTLAFQNTADGWAYADDPAMPLDTATLETMQSALSEVRVYRTIDSDEDFGFSDENTIMLSAKADETRFSCTIGFENAIIDKVYLMTEDGTIYTTDTDLRSYFEKGLDELLLVDSVREIDTGDITRITVENGENGFTIAHTDERELYYWFSYLLENGAGKTPLDDTAVGNYLSSATDPYLYCEAYAPTEEECAQAGMENPAVLTITYTETIESEDEDEEAREVTKTYQLLFGEAYTDTDGNAHRYVMLEDSEMLFSMTSAAAEKLLSPALSELAPDYLAQMTFSEVTRFRFTLDGETHTVTQQKTEDEMTCTMDGKALNSAFVESFFLDATLLTSEGGYTDALPDEKPLFTAEISLETEEVAQDYTLAIYSYNENFCIADFSGRQDDMLVSIRDVAKLTDSLAELNENAVR